MDLVGRTLETAKYLAKDPVAAVRTGQTPHDVVFRQNKAALRFFRPTTATAAPVFISMPLINTWSIWDLLPGRSTIAALVAAGVPVYVLDWGRPGAEDARIPLAEYVDGLLGRMLDRAKRHARSAGYDAESMDAIGYCVGGTFLAVHLARHGGVRRVAFVCTPIDFHASGRLAVWARPDTFPLDAIADAGNFPAERMRSSFQWLKPIGSTRKWVSLWERIDAPGFPELWAALEQWNTDNVDVPAEAYREYVRRCYFDNALMTGGWSLGSTAVDLGKATIPAVTIAATEDHIVPPEAAFGLAKVWGAPVECRTIRGGHVGIGVAKALPDALLGWIRERA